MTETAEAANSPETIEVAAPADIPALTELLGILMSGGDRYTVDAAKQARGLAMIVGHPEVGVVFVARAGGRVVGTMTLLRAVSTSAGERDVWLEDVVVHPDHRNGGLGGRLMAHVIAWARERGYARISLLTGADNTDGQRFYERHGFKQLDMVPMRLYL